MIDAQALWQRCLELIHSRLNESQFATWFQPIGFKSYSEETKEVTICVPSQYFYEYLENNYRRIIYLALFRVFGEDTRLVYSVSVITEQNVMERSTPLAAPKGSGRKMTAQAPDVVSDFDTQLNGEQTFDNFIEGRANRLPRSVGESVAKNPARKTFNPLFVYGPSGCGKTHLVNAIGMRLRQLHPRKKVLYVSAHLFQVQFVDARINNKINDFIHFYQSIDCLIVDDVQEFSGKDKTLEAFFHIFNHLHLNGSQIVMTSDRPPVELKDMEERMLTRFKWGMLAELESPDLELRRRILQYLVCRDGLDIPEEVIDYIAENLQDNVRELEGMVHSMLAHSIMGCNDIDLNFAQKILKANTRYSRRKLTTDDIVETVCRHYKITHEEIYGQSRKAQYVQGRHVAMYLVQKHTGDTAKHIGYIMGGRSHATVLHGISQIEERISKNSDFRKEIREIEKKF